MSLAFKKAKVYTKSVLFVAVAVAVAAILIMNRGNTVSVWFFWLVEKDTQVNVVWLLLWTAVGSIISWQVVLATWSLIKETRELKQQEELKEREASQKSRAKSLDDQERRIDQKIARSLGEEGGAGKDE